MQPIDTKGFNIVRVVLWKEVDSLTSAGWILLGTVSDSQGIEEQISEAYRYSGSGDPKHYAPRAVARFVLGKDPASELANAKDELAKLYPEKLQLELKLKTAEDVLEKRQKGLTTLAEELAASKNIVTNLHKTIETERSLKYAMEKDIAKVRVAIGDLRMREILGEPK